MNSMPPLYRKKACNSIFQYVNSKQIIESNSHVNRLNPNKRGYSYKWRLYRSSFLKKNPICVLCNMRGYIEQSTVVDHIIPHKMDKKLFWNRKNHQALCRKCHDNDKKLLEKLYFSGEIGASALNMASHAAISELEKHCRI